MGGALVLCPLHLRAEPYELLYSLVSSNQGKPKLGKSIKRPLVVDLVDHTLTLPSQVIGYTLTLESEEGEVYTYYITGTTLEIPQELSGSCKVIIFNSTCIYQCTIKM